MGRKPTRLGIPYSVNGKANPEYMRRYRAEQERIIRLWVKLHTQEFAAVPSHGLREIVLDRVWKRFLADGEEAALAEPVVKEEHP